LIHDQPEKDECDTTWRCCCSILAKAGDTYLGLGTQPGGLQDCEDPGKDLHVYIGRNKVYAPGGSVGVKYCGAYGSAAWLAKGLDPGTTSHGRVCH
jgi:hypothetical protein